MTDPFFQPISGFELPRFAGVPSFMRLPCLPDEHPRRGEVEIGILGVPWDGGTTNRPGARHGPRALRDASTMIRAVNAATGVAPFERARVADLGDIGPNPADLADSLARIERAYNALYVAGIRPLSAGGDHLVSLPILRGIAGGRAMGLFHVDAHTDLFDSYFGGFRYTHGTPFRRAIEEGLIDPKRTIQIGIRGTAYDLEDRHFAEEARVRVVTIEEFGERGVASVVAEAREILGAEPVYTSFDIDALDPAFAPGTGTPEVGGLTSREALSLLRGMRGIDIVGADLVEVSPPFDPSGATAWLGVSIMFELLCLMAEGTV
ncbi:MAG: agmatinase [Pseudomonadota bacterium]